MYTHTCHMNPSSHPSMHLSRALTPLHTLCMLMVCIYARTNTHTHVRTYIARTHECENNDNNVIINNDSNIHNNNHNTNNNTDTNTNNHTTTTTTTAATTTTTTATTTDNTNNNTDDKDL